MNKLWLQLLTKVQAAINKQLEPNKPAPPEASIVTYGAGRETVDSPYTIYYGQNRIKAKDKLNTPWQMTFLDERRIYTMQTTDLLKVLMEVSPDFNRALHDFTQFVITKHQFIIHDPEADPILGQGPNTGMTETAVVTQGKAIINEALQTMRNKKERFHVKLEKAAASIFLHGNLFSEVVLDLQGRIFSDFKIIDATLAEFERAEDPVDGEVYRLGQMKDGQFIDLRDDPTIDYIAFDAVAGSPVGRSLSSAGIFPLVFSLTVLKDLRQVIRAQGYPFKVATVDREKLKDSGYDKKEQQDEIIKVEAERVKQFLEQPAGPYTDVPIMGSEWDIKLVEGIKSASVGNVDTLIQIIERQIIRALKTFSVIFGINSNSGLSDNSDIQSELHYVFIDSIQRKVEEWIQDSFTEVLRARGNPGILEFKLHRINTLVSKQRSEIANTNAGTFKIYAEQGAISQQEFRDLVRHPDPLTEMALILPEELPPDAQRQPDEIIEVDEEESADE